MSISLAVIAFVTACAELPGTVPPSTAPTTSTGAQSRVGINRAPSGSFSRLVIFIHGIFGDGIGTWTHSSGVSWLSLLVQDSRFKEYGIYLVTYPTPKVERASGIEEIANGVLLELEDQRIFERYNEIYLIGHSMGGLIAKRILVDLNRVTQIDKLRRVKAVFYISTPAQGAPLAEVGSWLSKNPQLKDMIPADLNSFLQVIENMWQNLMRDRPRGTGDFPRAYCAYGNQTHRPFHGCKSDLCCDTL